MKRKHNKKILVITHQLSRTGAPIVLLDMIRVCKNEGYKIDVITMQDGELRENLDEISIPVRVQERFITQAEEFYQLAREYDLVIANTLITYEVIHVLNHSDVPVLWWLHEGKQYFEYFASVLPDFHNLTSNIHIFSVGHYVQSVIGEMYGYTTEILHFGVEDIPRSRKNGGVRDGRTKFLTAGTYSKVKAQDVLTEAIRRLPKEYLVQTEFIFCGNEQMYDEQVYASVKELSEEYENVTMLSQLSREKMLELMEVCDCLIVPSRIDPIPTVAVEMMMKEGICLCTDVCGVAHYMDDGVNGFTVPPEDAEALRDKIIFITEHKNKLNQLKRNGRKIYEAHFSQKAVQPYLLRLIDEYTHPREKEIKELASCIIEVEKELDKGLTLSEKEQQELDMSIACVVDYIENNYVLEEPYNSSIVKLFGQDNEDENRSLKCWKRGD